MKTAGMIFALALVGSQALAQEQTRIYGPNGRSLGTAAPYGIGSVRYRDSRTPRVSIPKPFHLASTQPPEAARGNHRGGVNKGRVDAHAHHVAPHPAVGTPNTALYTFTAASDGDTRSSARQTLDASDSGGSNLSLGALYLRDVDIQSNATLYRRESI
jgi:hypothetical protein